MLEKSARKKGNWLVFRLIELHRTQAAERRIQIELCAPYLLLPLLADVGDIEPVLTNLLSNANNYRFRLEIVAGVSQFPYIARNRGGS